MEPLWKQIHDLLAHCMFGPPASDAEITRAEQALGITMPEWLRELYRHFNGICGDVNTTYLFPINGDNGLIHWNQFLRSDWDLYLPERMALWPEIDWDSLRISRLLFLGNDGLGYGNEWGLDLNHGLRIIRFDCSEFDVQPVIGDTILDVYRQNLEFLAECARDRNNKAT